MFLRDTGKRMSGRRLKVMGYSYVLCDLLGGRRRKIYIIGKPHIIENLELNRNYPVMLEEVEKISLMQQDLNMRMGKGYNKTKTVTRPYNLRVIDVSSGYYTQPYECWEIIRI